MKVIAAHQQEAQPGKDSALKGSIAEDERHGSSTARGFEDNDLPIDAFMPYATP